MDAEVTDRKDGARQPAHEPKKVRGNEKDVELEVQELEERIAPMKVS